MKMTKTRAGELARAARRYGYFDLGRQLAVNCPQCRHRVEAYADPRQSVIKSLDAAVVSHLLMDCEGDQ
jgi:hypothetical protein